MSRLVFIYSSPVSTGARVTIEHHRYWHSQLQVELAEAARSSPPGRQLPAAVECHGGRSSTARAFYLQLVEVEQAFKELKDDLAIRPIYHQTDERIEAHIFVAFLAYCLQVTLKQRLRALAPGLTPRSVLEKMAAIQMVDVYLPTTDGRAVILSRYTEPEADQAILLQRLKMSLPAQPPPRVTRLTFRNSYDSPRCGADLATISHRKSKAWAILTVQLRKSG